MQALSTSETLDEFRRHNAIRQREQAEQRTMLDALPITEAMVATPDDCPYGSGCPLQFCEKCRESGGILLLEGMRPQPHRTRHHVAECLACQERERRERAVAARLAHCGLTAGERNHTFAAWEQTPDNRKVYAALSSWDYRGDGGIFLLGDTSPANPTGNGTGKSYALHALTLRLCEEEVKAVFLRTVDFLKELRASYDEERPFGECEVIERYADIPVLLWDDLGKEALRGEWAAEKFYLVIDERCRRGLPVVISSNFALDRIEQRFGDNFGPAIASRLAGMCPLRFKLGGPDRRMAAGARTAGPRSDGAAKKRYSCPDVK